MTNRRRLATLVLVPFISACGGGGQSGAPPAKSPAKVVVAPAEPKAEAKAAPAPARERVELSPYGIAGSIDLPPGTGISRMAGPLLRLEKEGFFEVDLSPLANPGVEANPKNLKGATPIFEDGKGKLASRDTKDGPIYLFEATLTGGPEEYLARGQTTAEMNASEARALFDQIRSFGLTDRDKSRLTNDSVARQNLKPLLEADSLQLTSETVITPAQFKLLEQLIRPITVEVMLEGEAGKPMSLLQQVVKAAPLKSLNLIGNIQPKHLEALREARFLESLVLEDFTFSQPLPASSLEPLAAISTLRSLSFLGKCTDDTLPGLSGLAKLERLVLIQEPITDRGLKALSECRGLRQLDLQQTNITDAGLSNLANCKKLRVLNLNYTRISGSGFAYLRGAPLVELLLNQCPIEDKSLDRLAGLPLETLVLPGSRITDAGLPAIAKLTTLRELNLSRTSVTDSGVRLLQPLAGLRRLILDHTPCEGNFATSESPFTALKGLSLVATRLKPAHLEALAKLPRLQDLSLDLTNLRDSDLAPLLATKLNLSVTQTRLTPQGLASLKGNAFVRAELLPASSEAPPVIPVPKPVTELPPSDVQALLKRVKREPTTDPNDPSRIIGLDLANCGLSDLDVAQLRDQVFLRSLSLSGNDKLTDACLGYLEPLKELTSLDLSGCEMKGDQFRSLAGMTKLTSLKLPERTYTAAQFAPLLKLTQLEQLNLQSYDLLAWMDALASWPRLQQAALLGDRFLPALQPLTQLRQLTVYPVVTDAGLLELKFAKQLRTLQLRGSFTEAGLAICKELTELTTLELLADRNRPPHLSLIPGSLPGSPATQLGDAHLSEIKRAEKLHHLRAEDACYVTDRGMGEVRDMHALAELTLRNARLITDKGVESITELKDLEVLHLPGAERLTDAILPALKKCEELRSLDLSGSRVTGKGLQQLAESRKLRSLNLAGSKVTDATLGEVRALPGLLELNLQGTAVSDSAVQQLQAARPMLKITR